ncbi:50S ribosomal protein L25 [Dehalococcoidia bacterium]|nr:50S ribosomal protein L25 [Dehalococcoidia bacterium]
MEIMELEVENRTTLRKKVKALRRSGMTPANIFGHAIESQAVQVNTAKAEKVLSRAGSTHMIALKSPSSRKIRRVLVKDVQRDPISGRLFHIDFYEVRMQDKVKVEVPLLFQGESPTAQRTDLVLVENLRAVEVECLPGDIPENIAIDLSRLAQAGDHILVRDLKVDGVTILTHAEEVIARVARSKAAEVREVAVEVEEAVAGGASGKG